MIYKKIHLPIFLRKLKLPFVFYFSFYLIFSPLFSSLTFAQNLPINPVPNGPSIEFSNNIPVINIVKPTNSGVSVNKFNDFNVNLEGLIINNLNLNSYNTSYKSELSGAHIEFNRNFGDGDAAKVILNEVVSNSTSSLKGYTEIYGVKADYIVANPNGITCAGCGFINTGRLSLITGSSNISNGNIESFNISPTGILKIEGVGVSNFGFYAPSKADLVSNIIKISGEVSSYDDLSLFSGNDKFDWKNSVITSNDNPSVEIGIDVSAMGALKANNIFVYATGNGFGVNLEGDLIADTGNIEITSKGEIAFKNLIAQKDVIIKSENDISSIAGKIVAGNNINISSEKNITISNESVNGNDIGLSTSETFENNSTITAENNLDIITNKNLINNSNIISKNILNIKTGEILENSLSSFLISYKSLNIISNILKNIGKINASDYLNIASFNIDNYGQLLSNGNLDLSVENDIINYRASGILSANDMNINVGNNLINYKADIYAGGNLKIEGRDDIADNFTDLDTSKTYNNPYIEEEVDPNTAPDEGIEFETDESEEEFSVPIILENGTKITLPEDAFDYDTMHPGDTFSYIGYTFIIGEETKHEKEIPNPEFQNCTAPTNCDEIPRTITETTYTYADPSKLTIKNAVGLNVGYTFEELENGNEADEVLGALDNTNEILTDTLNENKTNNTLYTFGDNLLNNLVNHAGRIEAGGNIEINANKITNKAFNFNTGSKGVTTYYDKLRDQACSGTCGWRELGRYKITDVNLDGIAGIIIAGGVMALNASDILNESSVLSSKGNMFLNATNSISNITYSEIANLPILMQMRKIFWKGLKVKNKKYNQTLYDNKRYYSKQRATIVSGGDLSISSDSLKNDQNINPTGSIVSTENNPNIEDGKLSVNTDLPIGDNGLFKVTGDGKYLIETNVPFIDVKDYVGSDYFFKGMGSLANGFDTSKVIGDPAYETKLVMDAIIKSTGEHYLENDGSIGSDTEQIKILYDNAIDVQDELNLTIGVALTKSQIENLKKDIIWYVIKEVNGQSVLVPELYLSQATINSIDNNNGSKISGFNVGIDSDFISNYGDIKSENLLTVNTKTLINEGNDDNTAKLSSNRGLSITADNILNLSGEIKGEVVEIKSDNLVNQTKVLEEDSIIEEGKKIIKTHKEILGGQASITGENGISLDIEENFLNKGANLTSQNGDIIIDTGTAIFDTVELNNRIETQETKKSLFSKKTKVSITETLKNIGSDITAGGNFLLTTKDDANFKGTELNVGDDAFLNVGGSTNILAAKDMEYNYSKTSKSYLGGLISKKEINISEEEKLKNANINVVDGLTVVGGKDINIVGSNINTGGDANLLAGYKLDSDGKIIKGDEKANVNIINDIQNLYTYEKEEKKGLSFPNLDISTEDGKVEVSLSLASIEENTFENTSSEVVSSNLNIGGNLQIGATDDIKISGSNLFTTGDSLLDADGDINITSAANTTNTEKQNKETDVSVSVGVGNSYVDNVNAGTFLADATKAVDDAKEHLDKIEQMVKDGLATSSALNDAKINLAVATANLTTATVAFATATAASATNVAGLGTGIYVDAGINLDTTTEKENTDEITNTASNIIGNGNITFNSNNMLQTGSHVLSTDGNITYNIENDLTFEASTDKYKQTTSTKNADLSFGLSTNALNNLESFGANANTSESETTEITYNNSTSTAENGDITFNVGGDMKGIGYNADGENITANIGGDLILNSLQNTSSSTNSSTGGGFNFGSSYGGNISNSKGESERAWVDNASSIIGSESVNITVDGKLSMAGSTIANVNNEGIDTGNLNIKANEIEITNITNTDNQKQEGFSIGTNIGKETFENDGLPKGSSNIGITNTGSEKESITNATIGLGNIEVANGDTDNINRDINNTEEITKDLITNSLDANLEIDNRIFSSETRAEMVKDFKASGSFIENVGKNIVNAATTGNVSDSLSAIRLGEVVKLEITNLAKTNEGKELLMILNGDIQTTAEERDLALTIFTQTIAENYGIELGDVKTFAGVETASNKETGEVALILTGGSYDKDNKDIYLNNVYIDGDTEKGLEVLGHETAHGLFGESEAMANLIGEQFSDNISDGLWINSMNSNNGIWNTDNGSSYVMNNTSDLAGVENKDNLIISGLILAGTYITTTYIVGDGDVKKGNEIMKDTDAYKYTIGAVNDGMGYLTAKGVQGADWLIYETGLSTDDKVMTHTFQGVGMLYDENVPEEAKEWLSYAGDVVDFAGIGAVTTAGTKGILKGSVKSVNIDINNIKFSQTSAGRGKINLYNSIKNNGYNKKYPIDVIKTTDGFVTVDNTRLGIVKTINKDSTIPAITHNPTDKLPLNMKLNKRFGDAKTWGEAIEYRTSNQIPSIPKTGTDKMPKLLLDKPTNKK